ncbi:hypothetical protein ACEXQD_17265 [Herbiconiux sp. P15]|uniref:hypothetical protein n=1 Tax=Herbiconiux liukaitaii TaxID=3342799 RepID=UPI0035B7F545
MMSEATFTNFLRTPKEVAARAEEGAVRITRRDAADLVLLRAEDLEHQQEGIALASRIMRSLLRTRELTTVLSELFAWTALLTDDEVQAYAQEIDRHVWSAAELGEYEGLLGVQAAWRATAEAYAAGLPRGRGEGLQWLDPAPPVDRP